MRAYKAVKLALFLVFCLLSIFLLTGNAHALMLELSLDELTDGADSIIIGTVEETSSQWNTDRTSIYTSVIIAVEEVIDEAERQPDKITVVIPGGEVEGIKQVVSDMPVFTQGEKVFLFLQDFSEGNILLPDIVSAQFATPAYTVFGLFQGKLDVIDEKIGSQNLSAFVSQIKRVIDGDSSSLDQTAVDGNTITVRRSPYVYNGQRWFGDWPSVEYKVNTSGGPTGSLTAIQNAAASWSNAGAKFSYSYTGTHSRTGLEALNGVNEVLWSNLGAGGTLAQAYWWCYTATGEIVEADIVFNTYHNWSTTGSEYDIETVALHEFGHWLSLDHSDIYGAIMWATYKGIQRTLHADDIAGIKHIYGASGGTASPNLLVSFTSGTWWYGPPANWERLSTSTAHALTYADINNDGNLNLVASFDSGTWYAGPTGKWVRLTPSRAMAMSGIDDFLIISFSSGTWEYWQGRWYRITTSVATAITHADMAPDGYLNPVFSFNSGTWYIEWVSGGWRWVRLSSSAARALEGFGPLLYASFPSGTWEYYKESWGRLSTSTAHAIALADATGDGFLNHVMSFPSGTWYIVSSGSSLEARTAPAVPEIQSWSWSRLSPSTARALQRAESLNQLMSTSLEFDSKSLAEGLRYD